MEDNEDQPADVRNATPVEEEIRKAEIDEQSTQPVVGYESKPVQGQQSPGRLPKTSKKPVKSKEDHCSKKLKRKNKEPTRPATVTVLLPEKPCTFPKMDAIPRHCLSKKEWIDLLATPSRKCPSPCGKKEVERKLRPVSPRINELALPTRQRMMTTLQDRGDILPAELVDRLINILEGETCLTPEQAEQLFRDKPQKVKKKSKTRKLQCKSSSRAPKKSEVPHSPFDKDAVSCQYLMAEAFVKSLLQWKCHLPKEEFKDIADIIIKRLSTTLEYTPVDNADRTTQQMKFLADIIAAWIAGVLFEVAEAHKEDLERECEERKKMKEEESEDETEESEGEEFIPQQIEAIKQLKSVEPTESREDRDKEDEKLDDEKDGYKTPRGDEKDDDDGDGDGGGGAGGAGGIARTVAPSEDYLEPPVDQGEPTEEEREPTGEDGEPSPDEEPQDETKSSPDEGAEDSPEPLVDEPVTDIDTKPSEGDGIPPLKEEATVPEIASTDHPEDDKSVVQQQSTAPTAIDGKPSEGDGIPPLKEEATIPEIDSTDHPEDDKSVVQQQSTAPIPAEDSPTEEEIDTGIEALEDDKSVTTTALPSALPSGIPEDPDEVVATEKEIDGKISDIKPSPDSVADDPSPTPGSTPAIPDVGDASTTAEVSAKDPTVPPTPQAIPSEQLIPSESSEVVGEEISTTAAAKSELKSSTEPPTDQSEAEQKADDVLKPSVLDITTEELSKAGIPSSTYPSSLPSRGAPREGQRAGEKESDFIEGNLRKMLQTDVPFLDLLRIFDRIENAVAKERENQGDDAMTDRIHRAIYEKLERLVNAETPERLTPHLRDVLDVLSGKIAQWVRNILTDSEILFLNENPPMVESGELRNFGKWLGEMSERANSWTIWMQNMINELTKMQPNQVTRADWQKWTKNFAKDALKWRQYYLESVHYAHHTRTMLAGREVVKTGELKYPQWSIQEKEIETIDFLQE